MDFGTPLHVDDLLQERVTDVEGRGLRHDPSGADEDDVKVWGPFEDQFVFPDLPLKARCYRRDAGPEVKVQRCLAGCGEVTIGFQPVCEVTCQVAPLMGQSAAMHLAPCWRFF